MASTISTKFPLPFDDRSATCGRQPASFQNRFVAQRFYANQKIVHYMMIYMMIFTCGVQAVVTQLNHGCSSLWIDSDGNMLDPDDIGASHISLILLKAAGASSFLKGSTYNNEFAGGVPEKVAAMQTSHTRAAGLGYNMSLFYDASIPSNRTAGTTALKNEIIAANSTNKLCIIGGGPYQLIYDAVKQANTSGTTNFTNVFVVTHSFWNMNRSSAAPNDKNQPHLVADFPTINHAKIRDQNGIFGFGSKSALNPADADPLVATSYDGVQRFSYLTNYSTENAVSKAVTTAYQTIQDMFPFRHIIDNQGFGDISDVGVLMYLLTGEAGTTVSMLKTFIECGISTNGTLASSPNNCISPLPAEGLGNLVLVKNPNTVNSQVYKITTDGVTYEIPKGTSFTIGFQTGWDYASPYDGAKMTLTRPSGSNATRTEGSTPLCINADGGGTVKDCYVLDANVAIGTYTAKYQLRKKGGVFDAAVSFTFIVSQTTGI